MPAMKDCDTRVTPPKWLRWAGFFLLVGYLLFSHGCHSGEDNELFAVFRSIGWK